MTTHELKAAIAKYAAAAAPTNGLEMMRGGKGNLFGDIGKNIAGYKAPTNAMEMMTGTRTIPNALPTSAPAAALPASVAPAGTGPLSPPTVSQPAAPAPAATPSTPATVPAQRQPAGNAAAQPNATPGATQAPATGPTSPAAANGQSAGPAGSGPALTSPEATQPNPQGGPSTAQKPPKTELQTQPSGPATEPTTAAPVAAPKTQPAPAAGYAGSADKAFADIMPKLSDDKIPAPERQQMAMSAVNKHVQSNPQLLQGMQDIQAGRKDTEAAKVFQSQIDNAQNQMIKSEFEKLKQANPNANLSDPTTWSSMMGAAANTAMSKFNEMPMEHKMLTGLGLGGGLIGILSSLFGGGGMAGGLLGMLGLAAGGVAGAAGGMFGNQAQAATGKMIGDFGNFMGMIPDEARDASNFNEAATNATKDRIAKAMTATMSDEKTRGQGAQIGQRMLNEERAKFEPLRNIHKTSPQAAYSYLMGMKNGPKTPEEAAQLYERLNKQYDATGQEGYLYNQTLDAIRARQQNPQTWEDRGLSFLKPESVMQGMGFQMPAQQQKGASMNIAQEIYFKQAAMKAARCWAGYEPVPGKAPYSENSCRPKRKKKKSKEPSK